MMKNILSTTFTASLFVGAVALAQEPVKTEAIAAKSTNYHRDTELRGMDLWTTVDTEDGERVDLGDINDFVINAKTGEIAHVVISSGGVGGVGDTLRTITWDQISWTEDAEGDKMASVAMSEKAFDAMEAFDAKKINAVAIEASAKREATVAAATNFLCSDLCDLDVYGPRATESFTTVGELVFNCDEGKVAYVTLEANDSTYLVPMGGLSVKPVGGQDADTAADEIEYAVYSPRGEEQLVGAPTINMDNKMNARNPEFRKRVDAFYADNSK